MKLTKLFGLILLLSMAFLFVQYQLRRQASMTRHTLPIPDVQPHVHQLREARGRDMVGMLCRSKGHRPHEQSTNNTRTGEQPGSGLLNNNNNTNIKNIREPPRGGEHEKEAHSIVFISGHRTRSSTVQKILLRFALTRDLNVLLPSYPSSSSSPSSLALNETGSHINRSQIVAIPSGQAYNILCHRIIFNKQELSNFFPPKSRTLYIGILRQPLYQSASAFYHYAQRQDLKSNPYNKNSTYFLAFEKSPRNPFRAFVSSPQAYDTQAPLESFTNNRQALDLGLLVTDTFQNDKNNTIKISKFVEEIDKQFILIMISEMFDESLILLRRVLRWNTEDVLHYTKPRIRDKLSAPYSSDIEGLSKLDLIEHQKWSPMDYALYDHFKSKLEGLVIAQGEGFQRELEKFREIREKVTRFCEMIKSSFRSLELRMEANEWSDGFCVTPAFCDVLLTKEGPEMSELVRKQQMEKM